MTQEEEIAALEAAVTKIQGAATSTVALVKGLAAYIVSHKHDPVGLQKYADLLIASADEMGDAVSANPVPA